jgi:hypothetical protein
MSDILWWANHPLQGNVTCIPTSRNLDTLEGHESRLSVGIRRILIEFLHMIEQEIKKLRRTRIDSSRASTLELLWGPLTIQEVLQPWEPRLSRSTLQEWTWEHYRKLNLIFFTPFCREEYGGIYRRVKSVLWVKVGLRVPTCQAGWPARVVGRPSFMATPILGIGCPVHWPSLTHWESSVWKDANT